MIVGCYSLHLYCDAKRSPTCFSTGSRVYNGPPEYTGATKGETQNAARKDGWSLRGGKATCPNCRKTTGDTETTR